MQKQNHAVSEWCLHVVSTESSVWYDSLNLFHEGSSYCIHQDWWLSQASVVHGNLAHMWPTAVSKIMKTGGKSWKCRRRRGHTSAFCLETGWPGGTGSTGNFVPVTSQIVSRVPDVGFFARPSTFCQMALSKKESCTKVTKNCMKS